MATHRTTKTSAENPLPCTRLTRVDEEAQSIPRGSALIVATLMGRLELAAVAPELGFEKHHGVS